MSERLAAKTSLTTERLTSDKCYELILELRLKMKRIMRHYRIPLQDREDLIQESFLQLSKAWETIHSPEGWLLVALQRQCLKYLRSKHRKKAFGHDPVMLALLEHDGGRILPQVLWNLRADLERTIAVLPPRFQTFFYLHYSRGYTLSEVAERMGYKDASMRRIRSRCLATLRNQLIASGYFQEPNQQ